MPHECLKLVSQLAAVSCSSCCADASSSLCTLVFDFTLLWKYSIKNSLNNFFWNDLLTGRLHKKCIYWDETWNTIGWTLCHLTMYCCALMLNNKKKKQNNVVSCKKYYRTFVVFWNGKILWMKCENRCVSSTLAALVLTSLAAADRRERPLAPLRSLLLLSRLAPFHLLRQLFGFRISPSVGSWQDGRVRFHSGNLSESKVNFSAPLWVNTGPLCVLRNPNATSRQEFET